MSYMFAFFLCRVAMLLHITYARITWRFSVRPRGAWLAPTPMRGKTTCIARINVRSFVSSFCFINVGCVFTLKLCCLPTFVRSCVGACSHDACGGGNECVYGWCVHR